jgi:hypothetical protein
MMLDPNNTKPNMFNNPPKPREFLGWMNNLSDPNGAPKKPEWKLLFKEGITPEFLIDLANWQIHKQFTKFLKETLPNILDEKFNNRNGNNPGP